MQEVKLVGVVSNAVSKTLGAEGRHYKVGDKIYLGENNINHIKRRHSAVFSKYGDKISQIISAPDYVGINKEDGSLEYIKIFSDHVKLVIRVAGDDKLYVRTLYTVYQSRTEFFIKTNRLKPLTKAE